MELRIEDGAVVPGVQQLVQAVHAGGDARPELVRRRQGDPAGALELPAAAKALSVGIDEHVDAAVEAHVDIVRGEGSGQAVGEEAQQPALSPAFLHRAQGRQERIDGGLCLAVLAPGPAVAFQQAVQGRGGIVPAGFQADGQLFRHMRFLVDGVVKEPAAGHGRVPALFQQPQAVPQGRACHHAAFLVRQTVQDAFHALPHQVEALPGAAGVQPLRFGLGAVHGGVLGLHPGQGQVGHETGHGRAQLRDGLLPVFRLARAAGTQAQGQTADLEPLGDEAVRLRQPGTLQQRSRVAHHLMQGACLFKGVQAALGLACPGQLEDGAVHGRFEMAQQTGPPFLEAPAHVFRHPVISCPPVEDGQGVPDGPGIRGGRAQGLDERVTGPAPFLPVHVRGQVGFGQPVQ